MALRLSRCRRESPCNPLSSGRPVLRPIVRPSLPFYGLRRGAPGAEAGRPPSRGDRARPTRLDPSGPGCSLVAGAVPGTIPSLGSTASGFQALETGA